MFNYISEAILKVHEKLPSPTTKLLLRSLYAKSFFYIGDSIDEYILGPVLIRKEESIADHDSTPDAIYEYYKREIKKFFGLSLAEYLDLNMVEKEYLVKASERIMLELSKEHAKITEEFEDD